MEVAGAVVSVIKTEEMVAQEAVVHTLVLH
jgi:hypothetical protein